MSKFWIGLALWTCLAASLGFLLGVLVGAGATEARWCRAVQRAQETPPSLRVYEHEDLAALRQALREVERRHGAEAWRWN